MTKQSSVTEFLGGKCAIPSKERDVAIGCIQIINTITSIKIKPIRRNYGSITKV